jgi:hypothetical protein
MMSIFVCCFWHLIIIFRTECVQYVACGDTLVSLYFLRSTLSFINLWTFPSKKNYANKILPAVHYYYYQ